MRLNILLLDNQASPREGLRKKLINAVRALNLERLVPFMDFHPSVDGELHAMAFKEAEQVCINASGTMDLAFVDTHWGNSERLRVYGTELLFLLETSKVLCVPYTYDTDLEETLRSQPWYATASYVLRPVFKDDSPDKLKSIVNRALDAFRLKVKQAAYAGQPVDTNLVDALGSTFLGTPRRTDALRTLAIGGWSLFHFILHAPEQLRFAGGNVESLRFELRRSVELARKALPMTELDLGLPEPFRSACDWPNRVPPDVAALNAYVDECDTLGRLSGASFETVAAKLVALHERAIGSVGQKNAVARCAHERTDRILRWDVPTFVDCLTRVFRPPQVPSGTLWGRVFACVDFGLAARAFHGPFTLHVGCQRTRLDVVAQSAEAFDTRTRSLGSYFLSEQASSTSLRGLVASLLPLYAQYFVVENVHDSHWSSVDLSRWTGDAPALFAALSPAEVESLTGGAHYAPASAGTNGVRIRASFLL